jgi:hypothetical protein
LFHNSLRNGYKGRPETSDLSYNITPSLNRKELEQPFIYSLLTLFVSRGYFFLEQKTILLFSQEFYY